MMLKQMAIAVALSCACATATAGYGFQPTAALAPDAAGAVGVAVGDVSGDGCDDVLVLAGGTQPFFRNRVMLYRQVTGGFAAPVAIDYAPDTTEYSARAAEIALADLDNDGDLDIVVSHGTYPTAALVVLRNDGTGFSRTSFPSMSPLTSLKFTDVDGDGRMDLLGKALFGDLVVLPGDGAAGFGQGSTLGYAGYATDVQLVDMDGDGRKDLLSSSEGEVSVRRSEGTSFSATPRVLLARSPGAYSRGVVAADFNGDGLADLVVSPSSYPRSGMLFYPQGKDGGFRLKVPVPGDALAYVFTMRAADLNGDGRLDLVTSDQYGGTALTVRLNRANGTFAAPTTHTTGSYFSGFTLGDLNNDGLTDVVLSSSSYGGVSYMLADPAAPSADLAVFLGLNAGAAVIRVENRGTEYSVGIYDLSLNVDARLGSVAASAVPNDCYTSFSSDGVLRASCRMPALAPGAVQERLFPITITAPTARNTLRARAFAAPSSPELRMDNNQATQAVRIDGQAN